MLDLSHPRAVTRSVAPSAAVYGDAPYWDAAYGDRGTAGNPVPDRI